MFDRIRKKMYTNFSEYNNNREGRFYSAKNERGIHKMTFEQAFLKIKEKFDKADAKGIDDFAIQVTFTDEDCGGTFYAEVKDGKLSVEPYDYYDNNAVLNISKSALLAVLAGRMSLDKAVANGDAYVQGDAGKIADWKKTIKNAPTKKPAAKKTAKKPAAKKPAVKKTAEQAAPKKTAVKKEAPKKTVAEAPKKAPAAASVKAPEKSAAVTPVKTTPAAKTTKK